MPDEPNATNINTPLPLAELARVLTEEHATPTSVQTLHRWVRQGLIPTTKVGKRRSTVAAVLAALRPDSAPKAAAQ